MLQKQDKLRGSLVGGAVGDALGYPVEFLHEADIFDIYGMHGIEDYDLNRVSGLASISDDTQMTLFTAAALVYGTGEPRHDALQAYFGWLHTQESEYSDMPPKGFRCCDALLREPALYARRAPGMTCMTGLEHRQTQLERGEPIHDFIADPINLSKGCGGIMRVAPLGLALPWELPRLAMEGAQVSALTHSHALGYMPSAVLVYILNRLVHAQQPNLKTVTLEARDAVATLFAQNPYIGDLTRIIDKALQLSENDTPDLENIKQLGQGWVAEEALAIPLYCCLRYPNDFSKAIIASVNHRGDSDSTGAITGNIMGAMLGYSAIEAKWLEKLELHSLILQLADSLYEKFYS